MLNLGTWDFLRGFQLNNMKIFITGVKKTKKEIIYMLRHISVTYKRPLNVCLHFNSFYRAGKDCLVPVVATCVEKKTPNKDRMSVKGS